MKCECHTSYNVGWLTFQVDDKLYNVSVGESNRPLEYARIWDDSGIIYLDDLQINIDTPDPPLFANEILEEYENNNGEESKGFSTGGIIGIVIAVVVVIVVVVSVYILCFRRLKKRKH